MLPLDQTAKALYSKFSVAQLRELALASKVPSNRIAQIRSRDEALGTVDAISDQHRLALLAHRVETLSPYKHCVLLEAKVAFTYPDVSKGFPPRPQLQPHSLCTAPLGGRTSLPDSSPSR